MNSVAIVYHSSAGENLVKNYPPPPDTKLAFYSLSNATKSSTLKEERIIDRSGKTMGQILNQVLKDSGADFLLYIQDEKSAVSLVSSALDLFLLTALRHPSAGLIFSDYTTRSGAAIQEVHLLNHHPGRVRDNQDFGQVLFFRSTAIKNVGGFDEFLKFTTMYDMRLKLAEAHDLVHVANRYSGSLYTVDAAKSSANVFDYLLASRDAQKEAEAVLSSHLKRIQAFLAPGTGYKTRPVAKVTSPLKASIIIPVNNRPEFIGIAIESVLAQTISETEVIIVVNGGPEDATIAAVKQFQPGGTRYQADRPKVRLIVKDINNIGYCINLGVRQARGEFYVQLDSDDRLKPDAVEKILKLYQSDDKIGMVIGSYEVWEKLASGDLVRMKEIPVVTHDEWTEDNGRNNLLRINGAGAPRSIPIELIKQLGFFGMNDDPYARNYGEDYDMVLRISEQYRIGRIYDPIYEVIRHSGGTDHSIDQSTVDRNDEAKDNMRLRAIRRRQLQNRTADER